MDTNNYRILIDVDSVLLRLSDRFIDYINEELKDELKEVTGKDFLVYEDVVTFDYVLKISPKKIHEFFSCGNLYHEDLEDEIIPLVFPEKGAGDLINFVRNNNLNFKLLTHSFNDEVAKSKEKVLKIFFNIDSKDVIHEKDKYLHVKEGDFIIDDGLHNHDSIREKISGVNHYVMEHPWNSNTKHDYFSGDLYDIIEDIENKINIEYKGLKC